VLVLVLVLVLPCVWGGVCACVREYRQGRGCPGQSSQTGQNYVFILKVVALHSRGVAPSVNPPAIVIVLAMGGERYTRRIYRALLGVT
jgi:hypothetical protein